MEDGIYGGGTYTDLPIGMSYYPSDNADAHDRSISCGRGVLLASYTCGQPARRLAALSTTRRSDLVIHNLARVHPQIIEARMVDRVVSWCWDKDPYSQGACCWFSAGQHEALYRYLIEPEGRVFFAGEHASLTHTWTQGATRIGLAGRGADAERASRSRRTLIPKRHGWAFNDLARVQEKRYALPLVTGHAKIPRYGQRKFPTLCIAIGGT